MSVMRPELIMKSVIPVVMAGIIAIYGLVVAVVIAGGIDGAPGKYSLFKWATIRGRNLGSSAFYKFSVDWLEEVFVVIIATPREKYSWSCVLQLCFQTEAVIATILVDQTLKLQEYFIQSYFSIDLYRAESIIVKFVSD